MDLTPIEHAAIATAITAMGWAIGIVAGCPTVGIAVGAAYSIGFFSGREHDQAEQRNIQRNYNNRRANAPWHVGFQVRAWDVASVCDVLAPTIAVGILLIIKGLIK